MSRRSPRLRQAPFPARAKTYAEGDHQVVLTVRDLAGNVVVRNWSFSVGVAPELSDPQPANGGLIPFNSRPVVQVKYQSTGAAINAASLRFYFDAEDVSALTTVVPANAQSGVIRFQPAQALSSDSHSVYVELANQSGAYGFSEWEFTVDSERLYGVDIAAPLNQAVLLQPEVEVLATVLSNRDFPREVRINDLRGRFRSQVPGAVTYAALVPVLPG
jgi:hypothetical protein